MAFPPPPEKEGIPINTEDYACLGEDQFLNDVIIDFYLKYLTLKVLTDEERERTHVFSSFFYQRLTTASIHRSKGSNGNTRESSAKNRHTRVCRWTKKIDLFSKDFIIIPINENAHWFLAIICFPGLEGPVLMSDNSPVPPMSGVPKRKSKEEMCNSTMTIGSTTITPVAQNSSPANTSLITQAELERKDEAESEDEDISMHSSDEASRMELIKSRPREIFLNGMQEWINRLEKFEEQKEAEAINGLDSSGSNETSSQQLSQQPQLSGNESTPKLPTSTPIREPVMKVKEEKREPIKQPCILIFDSLASSSKRSRIVATLRDYLKIEFETKFPGRERKFTKDTFKGACPTVPQQNNFTDCGLFVLQYVESFFETPIEDYRIPMKGLKNWFDPEIVSRKRYQIQQLLHQLMAEQNIDYREVNLPELNLKPDGTSSKTLVDYSDSNGGDMEGMDEEEFEDEELDEELDEEGEDEELENDSALYSSTNSVCNNERIQTNESIDSCSLGSMDTGIHSNQSNISNSKSPQANLGTLACLKNARIIRKGSSSNCNLSSSVTITTTNAPSDSSPPAAKKIRSEFDSA